MRNTVIASTCALAICCLAARVEQITIDLERPKQAFTLQLTEDTDATIRATLRASGAEFDPSGWTGLLWYGTSQGGLTLTNSAAEYGSMEWTVARSAAPTNGRYAVQILGTKGALTEEWGSGALTVRLSPSSGTLPAEWLSGNIIWQTATGALSKAEAALAWGPHAGLYATDGDITAAVSPLAETNALFATWLAGISGRTNLWNQAWAWGPHAGLYTTPVAVQSMIAGAIGQLNLDDATRLLSTNGVRWVDANGDIFEVRQVATTNFLKLVWDMSGITAFGVSPPQTTLHQLTWMMPDWPMGEYWTAHADMENLETDPLALTLTYDSGDGNTGTWAPLGPVTEWPATLYLDLSGNMEGSVSVAWQDSVTYQTVTNKVGKFAEESAVAAATNDIVQTYLLATDAWMTVSNQTLTVWRVADGVTNAHVIGGGGTSVDPTATNLLWLALNSGLAEKAPKAWGTLAPDGSPNPDPDFMTFLNAPVIMHASGFQWATSGGHAVLAESGAVAFQCAGETGGELRIGPDVCSNYFGFVRGESLTIGATPSGIYVTNPGSEEGVAQIVYPYAGGDFPVLWFAPSLSVPFGVLEGVVWADQENGFAVVTAPATTSSGFWYATTTLSVSAYFVSTMPAKFTGGVIGGTNAAPVVYDSTVTITSGGKTYRIPAQEVE